MRVLLAIDDYIIDRVLQPVINWAAIVPGLSRYNLSRILSCGSTLLAYLQTHHGQNLGLYHLSLVDFVDFFFFGIILYLIFKYECVDGRASVFVLPSARLLMRGWRYLMIVAMPYVMLPYPYPWTTFYISISIGITVSQFIAIYMLACRPGTPPRFHLLFRLVDGIKRIAPAT